MHNAHWYDLFSQADENNFRSDGRATEPNIGVEEKPGN